MSVTLTAAQAGALARVAADAADSLRLHQIGEDPDVLISWGAAADPRLLLRADGTTEPIAGRRGRVAGRARPE